MTLLQRAVPVPDDPALRLALSVVRERFTGLTTTAITMTNPMVPETVMVFKNGIALDPNGGSGGFSVAGKAITLGTAAVSGDVFLVTGWYRTGV